MSAEPAELIPTLDQLRLDAERPWPGLVAFHEADAAFFHGRDSDIGNLYRMVMRERLTVLFGMSGLGKTSLLQAGLFPKLRDENLLPSAFGSITRISPRPCCSKSSKRSWSSQVLRMWNRRRCKTGKPCGNISTEKAQIFGMPAIG